MYGVEEERLTREKHAVNTFPEQAIRSCLDQCGIELNDVDKIVLLWEPTCTGNRSFDYQKRGHVAGAAQMKFYHIR